ncbi:MAG: alpha-2-macroglobulin family protein [Paludibacter sp.]|nr:alpha-2-macroglobulin family protein [Paludibacter sp.]
MKNYITSILLTAVLSIVVSSSAQNLQSNTQTWEKVDQLIEQNFPESALKVLDSISRTPGFNKDRQEQIRIKLYQYRIQTEKDPDTTPSLLKEFEQFAHNFEASAEKQLLFCMAAEMYHNYYQSRQYQIDRRTDVAGDLPENPETWSKNHYLQKVKSLLQEAWKYQEISKNTDIAGLKSLFVDQTEKKDDINTTPTLFDYLAYKQIELSEVWKDKNTVNATYNDLIQFRKAKGDISLTVLAEINHINYLYSDADTFLQKADSLEQIYQHQPAVVEIMAQKANYYLSHTEIPQHKRLAFQICNRGIETYPNYPRIGLLKNFLTQIEQQSLFIANAGDAAPANRLKMDIRSTNIPEITLEVYRLNTTAEAFAKNNLNRNIEQEKDSFNKTLIETFKINMPSNESFEEVDTTFNLKTGDFGIYEYIAYPSGIREKEKMSKSYFTVTNLTFIKKAISEDKTAYYVLDRITGKQISNADIEIYNYKWTGNQYEMTLSSTGKTNSKGYTELSHNEASNNNEVIVLKKQNDRYFSTIGYKPYFHNYNPTENVQQQINVFTDRAIYRPGQTVYFKAIAYELGKNKQEVTAGKQIRFELMNANGESISEVNLTTNEFGSASGTFILPSGGLNGIYQIRAGNIHSASFSVEEYKRPNFEVTVTQPDNEISFGEAVTLHGDVNAFAGYPLPDAQIRYTVKRYIHPFWRWFPPVYDEKIIVSGETTTDANGKFTVQFTPEKDKNIHDKQIKQAYRYTITVDATDTKGETQQAIANLSVSEQSLFINVNIPELINKQDTTKFSISTQNITGKDIQKTIRYQIFSLAETADYRENLKEDTKFTTDKLMTEASHNTQSGALALSLNKYPSGRYKIIFTTEDKNGNPVESEHIFILYDNKDKRPPIKTYVWLPETKFESLPGEKVKVSFGTSAKPAYVLMEVKYGNQLISSCWIRMNNSIRTFSIPFNEAHRSGLTVSFTFVKDEQLFQRNIQITEKIIEKKLTPKLTVFRDKLLPGATATWTVNIPEVKAKGKMAELLAGMYDASLDELRSNQWQFNPFYRTSFWGGIDWMSYYKQNQSNPVFIIKQQNEIPEYYSLGLNWFGLHFSNFNEVNTIYIRGTKRKAAITGSISAVRNNEMTNYVSDEIKLEKSAVAMDDIPTQSTQPHRIRTNFNETAFFYPQLSGDSLGNYQFTFTMPESLTRWNLKMLAHTKDLYFGQAEAQTITQQDLMVQLNMPRFVRQSDKISLQASLTNLSGKPQKASVKLTFIDPATNQPLQLNDTNIVKADLSSDGTPLTLSWDVKGFEKYEYLICKVVADAGTFSDGEQRYLAILPDKVLVTESYPVFIGSETTKQVKFDDIQKLIGQVDTSKLTFEFSANPVWYAIQALPSLAAPKNENAVDYFIAWYVNTLAGRIIADNPRIKQVFEQIQLTNPDQLSSALAKNQELKNILLEETPWLTEAKDETEQQQRIALLFDLNQQQQLNSVYLDKLVKLQLPNGAFQWFDGMGESRWVTQFIAEGLLKARSLTNINTINSMLEPALNYLEGQLTKDYLQLKKQVKDYDKKMNINSFQLQFLSLRAQVNAPELSAESKEAMAYYLKQTEQYHNKFGLYDKALAALILHYAKKTAVVNAILKSLKENALHSEAMGMYWAKNTSGYFWNERPVSVQVKLMEAFNLVPGNETALAQMKTWLLRQKQTQQWDSPVSSVNAIYALTGIGRNLLKDPQEYTITVGSKAIDTAKGIPGSGYIKQELTTEEVKNGITIRRVNQSSAPSPAWGALYWQYYQQMDKVRSSGSALKAEKQLLVERIVDNRKTIFPINGQNINKAQQIVKKGDKIITRMVVTTDRNLEFVALKDNRAANLEPVNQLSGCNWKEQVIYYRTVKDASTQYFFNYLPKGTYVFEDEYYVNASGEFSGGTASIQCLYAPEFVGTSAGERLVVF